MMRYLGAGAWAGEAREASWRASHPPISCGHHHDLTALALPGGTDTRPAPARRRPAVRGARDTGERERVSEGGCAVVARRSLDSPRRLQVRPGRTDLRNSGKLHA